MAQLKEARVDILRCFCEENTLYYYDPSSMWRIYCDFGKILEKVKDRDDKLLSATDLES